MQVGATESSPGEWRGGTVRGGIRATLHAGDIATIPAGTPHQMILAPGERVTYVAVKVGRAAEREASVARSAHEAISNRDRGYDADFRRGESLREPIYSDSNT